MDPRGRRLSAPLADWPAAGRDQDDAKREFYRRPSIATRYESQRFGGAGGALVDWREQRLALALLSGPTSGLVLDAGCGTGRLLPALAGRGDRALGVDTSLPMLAVAQARRGSHPWGSAASFSLAQADAFALPLSRGSCAAAVSLRFLFHFADPSPLLRELRRVVRVGGTLVCDTAAWSPRALVPLGMRRWGARVATIAPAHFRSLAAAAGWRVRETRTAFFVSPYLYRRLPARAARALTALEARAPRRLLCRVYWALEAV